MLEEDDEEDGKDGADELPDTLPTDILAKVDEEMKAAVTQGGEDDVKGEKAAIVDYRNKNCAAPGPGI